ncbi:MAG: molybdopterin-dependent oxidoreductase [Clostridiales bacterium]|nr:molybdopterin-dependent oxidoreductase [Clostridiales bacterium]
MKIARKLHFIAPALLFLLCAAACAAAEPTGAADSGDPAYEALTVQIEGLRELNGGIAEISVAELRALPQHELEASYRRTTGLYEEFHMSGPLLRDVIALAGGNLDDYAGLGMIGRDNYYCLFSRETLDSTADLLLAVTIDGQAKLDADNYPLRAAVPGQFGPYWVKQVAKLVLYEEIPLKDITSMWLFANLAAGIEPVEYEYYGSLDSAIDLEQIFSRLDHVDSRAFFTMKSADGFKKNEAMNMVKSRYYLKIDGADAPTNVAPYIKLGMNVQKIAWISTNADAAIFPELLPEYMDSKIIRGQNGLPLDELLYEVEMETVKAAAFDLLGTAGERYRVQGSELADAILIPLPDGGGKVLWAEGYDYPDIENLLRIRRAK